MTLVRNPRYWGSHPAYLDRLIISHAPGDPVEELRKGELDIYAVPLTPEVEPDFRQVPGYKHVYAGGSSWVHFEIRIGPGGHPALRNKLVRRALAYGIDRAAIVKAIFAQFVPALRPSDSAVFLTRSPYYRPNWNGYRYQPSEARRLLAQAGCRPGAEGIYVCAGERLSLRFVTTAGGPTRRRALELAQPELRRAGIEIKPTYAPSAALFTQILGSGDFDVALFAYFTAPDPFGLAADFGCGGSQNDPGYCQRLVTSDLNQADRTFDGDRRARVLNRADARMARDVPVIPLWNQPTAATVKATIRGFEPSFPSLTWNAEDWWLDR
jgi:peptide/nickel transport system substrate-binding protein